jgi:3-phenylpropionate/cinnamic acid dioxygenase small subunit
VTIEEIADRLAIVDLLHRYATSLDTRDWDLLASVFTDDAIADYGELAGINNGVAAIVKVCHDALQGLDASQHIVSNEVIELAGDRARSRCYLQAQHVYLGAEGGDNFLVGGTYEDEVVRTGQGWRIAHRRLITTWVDGNASVFEAAAARLAERASHTPAI